MTDNRVFIFDTTLRDGEQSPGVNLLHEEKLEIARQLARLKVDIIEAGFPITSKGDFESVQAISREIKGSTIAALARTTKVDIDAAAEALQPAEHKRIHVFTSASDVQIRYMLRKTPEEVLESSVEAVKYAKRFADEVEWSGQDVPRADRQFLYRIIEAVIEAGADIINIPDTVGYSIPSEFADIIRGIRENVKGIDKVIISVHTHNDLGLATANALAAIEAGARQVECAVNGIGERAGNCALEEVVMALRTRNDILPYETRIDTRQIYRTSRLVSTLTGMRIQKNKAIVGENAFAHESGIHQDGVLKERSTYEIMRFEDLGYESNSIVLGKHSGRHAFIEKLKSLGYEFEKDEVETLFRRFKELTDRKKEITDADIVAIVEDEMIAINEVYQLESFHISSGNQDQPTASVTIVHGDQRITEAAVGDGPIEALCRAIDRAVGQEDCVLKDYRISAVTGGRDAQGEVSLKVAQGDRAVIGHAVSTDILEASAKAYLNALNKLLDPALSSKKEQSLSQEGVL